MKTDKTITLQGSLYPENKRKVEISLYEDGLVGICVHAHSDSLKCLLPSDEAESLRNFLCGSKPPTKMIRVNFDLYKQGGKWAYGGVAIIDQPEGYVDDVTLLRLIASGQQEVTPAAILNGGYTVIIKETPETMLDPQYQGFLCRMIAAEVE